MKVKITHTVRYEEVPNVVNELINKCRSELRRASELKFDILRLGETAREIRQIQDSLYLISSQLDDCLNLSHGYIEFDKQQSQVNEDTSSSEQGAAADFNEPLAQEEGRDEQDE